MGWLLIFRWKRFRFILTVVSVWVIVSLACNFPLFENGALGGPSGNITVKELRQTLAAQASSTAEEILVLQRGTQAPSSQPTDAQGTGTPPGRASVASTRVPPTEWITPTDDPRLYNYYAHSGDTLPALAARFDVQPGQITSPQPIPQSGFIPAGQFLTIPRTLEDAPYPGVLLPDSEVIFSPTTVGFDVNTFINQAGGYLSAYQETFQGEQMSGVEVLERVAVESSLNPKFLLAILEFRSGWVYGQPRNSRSERFPLGFGISGQEGLYREMVMTATHFHLGYYGWRAGTFTEMKFNDGSKARLSPDLNAGSAGVQNIMAKFYDQQGWVEALYGSDNFPALYASMFGDPWTRDAAVEPLFAPGLAQPELELPFAPGERWSLTGGPHEAWKTYSPRGAIDLAPVTGEKECAVSRAWATASAPGLIVRSARNAVAIDLDGDGHEGTGWVLLYYHVADKDRIQPGTWVEVDDRIGHPSCEGGRVTGTHVHIARKYNGEWLSADGPLPFVLGGWRVYAGEKNYQGEMRNEDRSAVASPLGPGTSIVTR